MKYILLFSLFFINPLSLAEETTTEPTEAQTLYEQGWENLTGAVVAHAEIQTAFHYFEQSANLGHAEAQVTLGFLYASGSIAFAFRNVEPEDRYYDSGHTEDLRQAKHWLEKAAQQGDADIQYRVGKIIHEDLYSWSGNVEDKNRALHWLQQSADQGHQEAIGLLNVIDLLSKI